MTATSGVSMYPTRLTGDTNGATVTLAALGAGGQVAAVQHVGEASEDFVLSGKVQWTDAAGVATDLPNGAFSAVGSANSLEAILFTPPPAAVGLRWVCTLSGDPAEAVVAATFHRLG